MSDALLEELKGMDIGQILEAVVVAKTGSRTVYANYVIDYTKQQATEALEWLIEVAEEEVQLNRYC